MPSGVYCRPVHKGNPYIIVAVNRYSVDQGMPENRVERINEFRLLLECLEKAFDGTSLGLLFAYLRIKHVCFGFGVYEWRTRSHPLGKLHLSPNDIFNVVNWFLLSLFIFACIDLLPNFKLVFLSCVLFTIPLPLAYAFFKRQVRKGVLYIYGFYLSIILNY